MPARSRVSLAASVFLLLSPIVAHAEMINLTCTLVSADKPYQTAQFISLDIDTTKLIVIMNSSGMRDPDLQKWIKQGLLSTRNRYANGEKIDTATGLVRISDKLIEFGTVERGTLSVDRHTGIYTDGGDDKYQCQKAPAKPQF